MARTNNSRKQTIISYIILLAIVLVFAAIIAKQKHFSTSISAIAQKTIVVNPPAGQKTSAWLSVQLLGPDFKPANDVENYNADNLYEKIDGKADLYLQNGFISLVCRRYSNKSSEQNWVELYVYDMARTKNAFAVYSGQKRTGRKSLDWAQFGYKTTDSIYIASGNFYFEIILSADSNGLLQATEAGAKQLAALASKVPAEPFAIGFFPKENMVTDSYRLIGKDAFGCEGMDNIFAATYRIDSNDITAYVADMNDANSAQALFDKYHKFLIDNGGKDWSVNIEMFDFRTVELFGTIDMFFKAGNFFAGVRGSAPSKDLDIIFRELMMSFKQKNDKR